MNMHVRKFEDHAAVREHVPLLIGLMGPSGSGKTFSAFRLATGIQSVTGGDIYVIDTEANRAKHYADKFKFRHVPFTAPFSPSDYLAAIQHCVDKGAKIIIVDSMSHEHEGPGGVLEMHEAEVQKLGGGARNNFPAWAKPKADRRKLINALLQMNCNFIFCFRAKEKAKPVKRDGKSELENQGWMPIAGEEFIFEQTANMLLMPGSNGRPTWQSEFAGERSMMKLPEQFRGLLNSDNVQLTEEIGKQLAEWAKGGPPKGGPPREVNQQTLENARVAASGGSDVFKKHWEASSQIERADMLTIKDELLKTRTDEDKRQAAIATDEPLNADSSASRAG